MDDNAQGAVSQPAPAATQKQQVTDLLRSGTNIVITTGSNPSTDAYAATIALSQMLSKLGKRAEAVISKNTPKELGFLPTELLSSKFAGLRDFVIELDISKTEADKLKYVPEGKRLKIYITPYNGNFTKDDLGFSYGDYHCDGVIVLGANNPNQIDNAIASQKQLMSATKVFYVTAGVGSENGPTVWNEPNATSISEMLMSLTEALQPGMLDNHIATSLLTGIMSSTNHFTALNTTPKVMTMAAQLMAAGANQAEIVQNLQSSGGAKNKPTTQTNNQNSSGSHELKASGEETLPHKSVKPNKKGKGFNAPNLPAFKDANVAKPVPPPMPPIYPPPQPPVLPPTPQLSGQVNSPQPMPTQQVPPQNPAHNPMISAVRTEQIGNAYATVGGTPLNTPTSTATPVVNSTPGNSSLVPGEHKTIDLDAARRAVEAAAGQVPMPQVPPTMPAMPTQPGTPPMPPVNPVGPQPPTTPPA